MYFVEDRIFCQWKFEFDVLWLLEVVEQIVLVQFGSRGDFNKPGIDIVRVNQKKPN